MPQYSESTLRILQVIEKNNLGSSIELGILNYLIDCIAAMKEIYAISECEDHQHLSHLVSPFLEPIGNLLQDCYLETSAIAQCSRISRQTVTNKILTKFPEFSTRKVCHQNIDLPLMHYAIYNCREIEMIRSLSKISPTMLQVTDSLGAVPLHWAAIPHPSIPLRDKYEIHSYLLEQCPTCVFQDDAEGLLPLHWAVNQDTPDLQLITQLVESSRESVSKPSNKGHLPLHLAVNRSQPVPAVVILLLDCYPEGIREPCQEGWLPLHYCMNRTDVSLSILKILVERYPEGVNYRSNAGQVPLHRLLDHPSPAKRAAKYLIQTDPNILKVADNDGYLPLHTLLSCSDPPASSLVKLMVHSSFSSVKQKTNDGWLPVHLAIKLTESINPTNEDNSEAANGNAADSSTDQVRKFLDNQPSESKITFPLQRIVAILQELLSVYPESLDEYVVDLVPPHDSSTTIAHSASSSAHDLTLKAGWKRVRWTPMSYALAKGKHSTLARALRPFRKKAPLAPTPPGDNSSNMMLPNIVRSPPRHASSTGNRDFLSPTGFHTPTRNRGALQTPPDDDNNNNIPLFSFSSLVSTPSQDSPNQINLKSFQSPRTRKKNEYLIDTPQEESVSDLV